MRSEQCLPKKIHTRSKNHSHFHARSATACVPILAPWGNDIGWLKFFNSSLAHFDVRILVFEFKVGLCLSFLQNVFCVGNKGIVHNPFSYYVPLVSRGPRNFRTSPIVVGLFLVLFWDGVEADLSLID